VSEQPTPFTLRARRPAFVPCQESEITHHPNDRHNVINFVSGDWARSGAVGRLARGTEGSRGLASPVGGTPVLAGGRRCLLGDDLSSLATKYRSGVLMQRDLRPERAAIERRSSPLRPVVGGRPDCTAARPDRRRSTAAQAVSATASKRLRRTKNVDEMDDAVITADYRCLSV